MKTSTRDNILKAAVGLFAEKGYAATTTREICEAAGVTKPVLYYYFESKERLYRELVLDACHESRKQLLLASQGTGDTRQKLIDVMTASFSLTRRNPKLSMMFLRMVFPSGEGAPAIDCVQDRVSVIAGVVEEGIRKEEIRGSAQKISEALLGLLLIYSISYVLTGNPKLDDKLAREIVNLFMDGCSTKPCGR